jgi:hypothetical protein
MISVQKERITVSQILIFAWALGIALGVVLFFQFVDGPADLRALEVRDRVDLLVSRLKWITQTVDAIRDPQLVLDHFAETDRNLGRRFPDAAEKSLAMLADYANKFGVRTERIQTEKPRQVLTARGGKLGAGGKTCTGVQVSMKFKSDYYNLIKYLDTMRKILPAFLVVRNMTIDNNFSAAARLEGKLDLSLYLLE